MQAQATVDSLESPATKKTQEVRAAVKGTHGRRKWILISTVVLALGAAAAAWFLWGSKEAPKSWRTAGVDRGDIVTTATATGNLQPGSQIAIGAEVSGRIQSVEVDFNAKVTQGQVLARFETEDLDNAVKQAGLSLDAAKADVQRANATYEEARADEARLKQLAAGGAASRSQLTGARAATLRASADVYRSRANLHLAEAKVENARNDRDKAVITSPVNGVVLERKVEPGNTVAASLQSPELFVVAEDLSKMELHIAIDEADVGQVQAGQKATFTVDAWPEETFPATVEIIHLSPTVAGNVVTYTAVLTVDNSRELLRPGMTALATITTDTRSDVLRVPSAALRYQPARAEQSAGFSLIPTRPRGGGGGQNSRRAGGPGSTLWVLRDGQPQRIAVKLGRTDGRFTEVLEGELTEGDKVITGEDDPNSPAPAKSSGAKRTSGQGGQGGQGGAPSGPMGGM